MMSGSGTSVYAITAKDSPTLPIDKIKSVFPTIR